jgi:asparagine synthase (glutamine-hydrolysing)
VCGICGLAGWGNVELVRAMAALLRHRGPDGEGTYTDDAARVFLGMRRLAILDPEHGTQPVSSEDGSVWAVHNGEIYNHRRLRRELEARGHRLRSASDAEVLPHLYEEHGERFVERLEGMFAIALWDARRRILVLARDRLGIKPLYLWQGGGGLAFASEVKAFLPLPGFSARLDAQALHFLLNVRYVPGRASLFAGVERLPAATCLVWERGARRERRYWQPPPPDRSIQTRDECVEVVRDALERAASEHLESDVPLGLFLSGGLDSSVLLALVSRHRPGLPTFALGFGDPGDELERARRTARWYGTEHHESTLPRASLATYPRVVWHVEEPKVNASQLFSLAELARRRVTVALSGLGGDELFGGYRAHDIAGWLAPIDRALGPRSRGVVRALREPLAGLLRSFGGLRWDLARRALDVVLAAGSPARRYLLLRNQWEHDRRMVDRIYTPAFARQVESSLEAFFAPWFDAEPDDPREALLRAELVCKLPDDFLVNEDRMAMAHGLEVRVPFLDHRLVELVYGIPARVRLGRRPYKPLLSAALGHLLPPGLAHMTKQGFAFDSYRLYRRCLRDVARRELDEAFIREQGIFRWELVRAILEHPPSAHLRWHYHLLWLILGLKVWQRLFVERLPLADCGVGVD